MYRCPKCGKTSYQNGGRPVCCHCGKAAPITDKTQQKTKKTENRS